MRSPKQKVLPVTVSLIQKGRIRAAANAAGQSQAAYALQAIEERLTREDTERQQIEALREYVAQYRID